MSEPRPPSRDKAEAAADASASRDRAEAATETSAGRDRNETAPDTSRDFVRERVARDIESGAYDGRVHTRFPPEPNGYLHIGHAKSICLNFGIAAENDGLCNLRFDDTNPTTEDAIYAESIQSDIRWLGFDWEDRLYHASDYFEQLYTYAEQLVKEGHAYVCALNDEQIREFRGTVKTAGKNSPHRDRPVDDNLDLLRRMRAGEFEDGSFVLRAKIDMASPNMKMRDPLIYRIRRAHHYRTEKKWCIYPMYDFAHGLSDSIEGITHSICTLEFENNRELYDWFLDTLCLYHPQQIEFARLNLSHTIMSKRKLKQLVDERHVSGWDDPRMPTLSGLRRRGYTPESIRAFCTRIGVAKNDSVISMSLLEHFLRDDLNRRAQRVMAVLHPLRVVIDNYPEDQVEQMEAVNNPEDAAAGTRMIPFSRVLYIERDDFREDPPRKFFRLAPDREVRLKHAYFITCSSVVKNAAGDVIELRCTYDPGTRGGDAPDGRKVRGTLHWVSEQQALDAEVRIFDPLLTEASPDVEDFSAYLNPNSRETLSSCKVEPSLAEAEPGTSYQFLRHGYFCADMDSARDALVFNRAVSLRDSWAKIEKAMKAP